MSFVFEIDSEYHYTQLTEIEEKVWKLYCDETKGAMSAKVFWQELPQNLKLHYLEKVKYD